jgi:carboxyl-terminal processing protease
MLVSATTAFASNENDTDHAALGREVVQIVREHFLDAERAKAWANRHSDYAAGISDGARFASRTNEALAELETSHTQYYLRGSAGHWGLLAIFSEYLEVENVEYDGIGIDVDERGFLRRVLAGGPAAKAGLLRGDRIVAVDGTPYQHLDPFAGQAEKTVDLTIERVADGTPIELPVRPRRINPKQEWLEAQNEAATLFSREGVSVAYLPLLWCVGDEVTEWMRESIAVTYRDAQAMILDFRDGWGGCNADFLNFFNTTPPVLTLVYREGKRFTYDPQWRKPLYVLINGGSRSGKEVIAHALQRHEIATLVGQTTAGFVVGGRPFLLSDGSLLYVAVADGLVDGERLEGVGASPDVVVADRLEYAAGADPQLERAIEMAVERCKN